MQKHPPQVAARQRFLEAVAVEGAAGAPEAAPSAGASSVRLDQHHPLRELWLLRRWQFLVVGREVVHTACDLATSVWSTPIPP